MAVIGGLALSAWNHARYTRDADLLIGIDESQANEVLAAVVGAGFHPKHLPPILQIDDQKLIQLKFTPPEGLCTKTLVQSQSVATAYLYSS